MRQVNNTIGVGGPIVFEICSFLSEGLAELYESYQKVQRRKEFEQVQIRLRQEAGHDVRDDMDVEMGKRQKARAKMAKKAFGSAEREQEQEEERKKRQTDRLEKIQDEDRYIRQSMADRAIAQREHERHQEEIRKAGRSAMSAAFNRGETPESAREAARKAEADYRESHGLGRVEPLAQNGVSARDTHEIDSEVIEDPDRERDSDVNESDNEVKTTPTTAAFMERLRSMYVSASQEKQQLTLREPKASAPSEQVDLELPQPVPSLTQEAAEMMDDIIAVQHEQPWLISDEARVPTVDSTPQTTGQVPLRQEDINHRLKEEFERKSSKRVAQPSSKHAKILEQRKRLPAFSMKETIVQTINDNQISLVKGSTGCGKTTQVPQFVLADMIANNRGSEANIIVTQPRRISAVGVAERISSELGEQVGRTCGYSIKLEKRASKKTRILLCTTGILLRRLQIDPDLASVSHVL